MIIQYVIDDTNVSTCMFDVLNQFNDFVKVHCSQNYFPWTQMDLRRNDSWRMNANATAKVAAVIHDYNSFHWVY